MQIRSKYSYITWISYHSGLHDIKNRAELLQTVGVAIGVLVGRKIAIWLGMKTPEVILFGSLCLIFILACAFLLRVFIQREQNIVLPESNELFSFEFIGKDQVVWHSAMDNNTIESIPLYKSGFRARKISKNGDIWYILVGRPEKRFVEIAKHEMELNGSEYCYGMTQLSVSIKLETITNSSAITFFESLCSAGGK